jgi:peptidoglycan/xylan/chitin deacetylase (PgdA/CDA1 family)
MGAAVAWLTVLGGVAGHTTGRPGAHRLLAGASSPPLTSSRRARAASSSLPAVLAAGNQEIARLAALGLPVYCGARRGKEIAFTFDDGPGVYTYLALNKLRQARERATFFVVGRSIVNFPGYLRRELKVAALGDHTYTHPDLLGLSPAEVTMQLQRAARLITVQSGQPVDLWRPPYGASDASIGRIARRLGLLETLWSVDSRDSLGANWLRIIKIVEAGLRPGAIVLMHENRGQTIRALTTLLPYLQRHHLRSVSLAELLASDPPSVAQLRRGWSGCGERTPPGGGNGLGGD